MKLFYVFVFIMVFSALELLSYAQILVQKGTNVKIYTISELQKALDSADSGSDVYIPGGFVFSGNYNVRKKLNIWGAGGFDNGTTATGVTELGSITFLNGSDSSSVEGIKSTIYVSRTAGNYISNLKFTRIKILHFTISEVDSSNNIIFKDCVILFNINNSIGIKSKTVSFYNCIFDKSANVVYNYSIKSSYNTNFVNCIFHLKSTGGVNFFLSSTNSSNNLFENCIFRNYLTMSSLGRLNIFKNCLITVNQTDWGAENMAVDCLINQHRDSIFVFQDNVDNYYSEGNDYNLKNTCLGKNYGTDGTDIGIYGTNYPFKENGVPIIPQFKVFSPAIKAKDGYLEVQLEVEAQTK